MVNFAIIGTSKISEEFVEAVSKTENCKIKIVYSRSFEKGKSFADRFNIPEVLTSFEELLEREDIQAVYVASPNSIHKGQSIRLLNAKKHVLCEKPIGITEEEVEEMFSASRKNGVALMEAMKNTCLPNFKSIKENLYKIGDIRGFINHYSQYSSRYDLLKEGTITNIFDKSFGGGADLDLGVYPLYFTLALLGIPKSTSKVDFKLSTGVSGMGVINLEYDNMVGSIIYSKITNSYIPSEIQGEKGSILIDSISRLRDVKIKYPNGEIEDITVSQDSSEMIYELQEFLSLIENNKIESNINTFELSRKVIEILTNNNNF